MLISCCHPKKCRANCKDWQALRLKRGRDAVVNIFVTGRPDSVANGSGEDIGGHCQGAKH
jgi:hypothetical protein